ncbi:MAG: TonB-dependent receptor [Bacteroidales bacterium]|nr:TonB-dependent receptor [Bacteroidales bacterium]MCB9013687.1 TonB-dependent receptor [Bacteroidales bacterium]
MKQRICPRWKSFLLFLMFLPFQLFGQVSNVTGKVTDEANGTALPGVTIIVKGTTAGTVTDIDGTYSIKASTGQTLVFSYIGYSSKEVVVENSSELNISLSEEKLALDELVVIGYGTVKKSDATGSISTVSSKDFNKGAITSAQELLVGKSAGVVITTAGGAPGSGATIRIRGGSSLNASNDPLIIIDGVPIDNNNIGGSANLLAFVNPNDIESMTVLKDASATAIYGSRASNGVIIITTKKGKVGSPMKISYNANTSMAKAIKFVDVYSADSLRALAARRSDLFNAAAYAKLDSVGGTDWQDEIFRTAISQDHNLSISGAYKNLPYRVSVGYTDQNGIMKNTDMQRLTGSLSLEPTFLNNDLKVSVNVKGMNTKNNFGDAGALGSAVAMDPTKPIYDTSAVAVANSAGYFQWSNYGANLGTPNPVEQLMEADNHSTVNRVIGNVQADYRFRFLPELHANLNLATDYQESVGYNNRPTSSPSTLTGTTWGKLSDYNGKNYNNLLDFYLNYRKDLSQINSTIDVTGGYSWQHFKRESGHYTRGIYDATHPYQQPDSIPYIPTENYLISFFGRANYTLANKYLLTFTIRDDGSSRFAKGNRWGLFPSAAFAWKINEESFLKDVEVLSDLKLRLGWGVTGQQDIGNDYPSQARYRLSYPGFYYPIGGVFLPTLRPDTYDPGIKWEETTTQNIGLDFGFAKDRITGAIDVYKRVTSDMLNEVTIPSGSNFSNTLLTNVGSLENKGVEFSLNLIPISKKDMFLSFGFNLTYNENKITKLLITDDPTYLGITYGDAFTGYKQVSRVGYPAYSYFVNKQVYYPNGLPVEGLYVDLSGMGGVVNGDNADKYVYHNPAPVVVMGFSGRFNYKAFDLSFSSRVNIGNYVYNQVAAGASLDQMYQIGYWHNETTLLNKTNFVKRQFTSDYFVTNASFFKLDNVSAGYLFDNIFDKLSLRVSLTAQNLMTITKYEGIDPEVPGGIDNNFYPRPRTYMLGINLTF